MRLGISCILVCVFYDAFSDDWRWPSAIHDPFIESSTQAPLESVLVSLHYAEPKEILVVLKDPKNNLLSPQGLVIAQDKQRRIWMEDHAENIKRIQSFIKMLDQPRQEIRLKARIVSVDEDYVRDLGVFFRTGSFTLPVANLKNGFALDVELNALEKSGHATIISSPELVTLDHEEASIEAGDEVPYQQETVSGGTSVAFKKAVLELKVTPHILSRRNILLDLHMNQDKVSALTVQGVPAIHTQQLTTHIELKDGQTFVLGGIYEKKDSNEKKGVPILKDIPVMGYLFQTHTRVQSNREMLVFMTPEIVDSLELP